MKKILIKSASLLFLAAISLQTASCQPESNDAWYLGEWTDGENSFKLTETTYSNPGWGDECPIRIDKTEFGTHIYFIDPDADPDNFNSGEIFGYDIQLDEENREIILSETWHGAWSVIYQKVTETTKEAIQKEKEVVMARVKSMYKEIVDSKGMFDPVELDERYCSKAWNEACAAVRKYDQDSEDIDIGFFEYDYHIMAQEVYELSLSELSVKSIGKTKAIVYYEIHNAGETTPMQLNMVKENGEWRIDNFIPATPWEGVDAHMDLRFEMDQYVKQ